MTVNIYAYILNKTNLIYKFLNLKYIFISGFGWILDILFYSILIIFLDIKPLIANFISATLAAMMVFYVSSSWLFSSKDKNLFYGGLWYFFYTEINIIIWSYFIDFMINFCKDYLDLTLPFTAIIIKILVTPISLLCNYTVTRFLAK
jgi:putative flippase GtrA